MSDLDWCRERAVPAGWPVGETIGGFDVQTGGQALRRVVNDGLERVRGDGPGLGNTANDTPRWRRLRTTPRTRANRKAGVLVGG